MKTDFMALLLDGKKYSLVKRNGEYDAKYNVYYTKTDDGWTATDEFSGRAIVLHTKTKKECQEKLAKTITQIKNIRCGDGFLKAVIDYQELLEDEKIK